MKKRILSVMLTVALILTSVPMMTFADAGNPVYYGKGNYVYELNADPDTGSVPSGFGTSAYNGKIWTDKSVAVNAGGTDFNVKLKALAQEYVSTASSSRVQETLADVVFVLDFTSSMYSNTDVQIGETTSKETRIEALVEAFNEAANIITSANKNNRISVYGFGGSKTNAVATNFMPLASYSATDDGKFIEYLKEETGTGRQKKTTYSVKTLNGVKKNGSTFNVVTTNLVNYTCSQYAIAASLNGLISDINSDTGTSARKPYVIFMTDGAATEASQSYDSTSLNTIKNAGLATTDYTNGTPQIAAATILTACVWKDKLQAAYNSYNEKNGHEDKDLDWFNIGLAISDTNMNARGLVDPNILKESTATGATNIKDYMGTYEEDKVNTSTPNYYADGNYAYYTHDYVYFCNTTTLLNDAFLELASLVEQESASVNIPIVSTEASGDVSSDMVFTDYIGEGMEASGFTLQIDKNTAVVGNDDDHDGKYTFEGYGATVTVSTEGDTQKVVWNLPASELAMYTFADRKNLDNGSYVSADPSVLSYNVKLKADETLEDFTNHTTYTNAVTSGNDARTMVEYTIPGDNTYYFNVTNTTGADGKVEFASSVLKNGISEDLNKDPNTTGTATKVRSYNYAAQGSDTENSLCNVTGTLGNNGKIKTLLKAEKTVDKNEAADGKEVTYTTTVTNYSGDEHGFVIKDIFNTSSTDTTETTTQTGTVDGSSENDVTETVTVTGEKDAVIHGNDPIITMVDERTVNFDEDEGTPTPNEDLDVTIIEPRFKITYVWTNAPAGVTLPTNSNTYKENDTFLVDTDYTSSSVKTNEDPYGNVVDKWTFSGWNSITIDAQDDAELTGDHKMPESDITIHGTWTHTEVTPDNYYVTYVFDGEAGEDYPTDRSVAEDGTVYVNGQPFEKSSAPIEDSSKTDDYGNVIRVWTFDGWGKVTKGTADGEEYTGTVIPASDLVIHGTWSHENITLDTYNVTYVFDGTAGVNYPTDRNVAIDGNDYVNGETFVKSSAPIEDSSDTDDYGNVIRVWTFDGWGDVTKGTADGEKYTGTVIPASDLVIHGTWSYENITPDTYNVTYVFDTDAPSSAILPTDGTDYVNGQGFDVADGYDNVDVEDDYGNVVSTWVWEGWYKTTKTTADGAEYTGTVIPGTDLVIHGKWRQDKHTLPTYSVKYVFDTVAPSSAILPTDSTSYVNNQKYNIKNGYDDVDVEDDYGNVIATWVWEGWYKTTKDEDSTGAAYTDDVIPGDNLTIHGKWRKDTHTLTEYHVTYVFDGTAGVDYPTDPKPTVDNDSYVNNQDFEKKGTYADQYDRDEYGNVKGIWHFEGWNEVTKGTADGEKYTGTVIPASDLVIHGTWSYTAQEVDKYNVRWVFDGEYPEVTLPSIVTGLVKGQDVPADTKYYVGYTHTDTTAWGNPTTVWTFEGWNTTTKDTDDSVYTESVMPAANLTIYGTWEKEDKVVNHYNITYVFDGEAPDKEGILPKDTSSYENNQLYGVAENPASVTDVDEFGNTIAIWTFESWYKTTKNTVDGEEYTGEKRIPDADLVIHGTWSKETVVPNTYNVTYVFDGDVPADAKLPVDTDSYRNNQEYNVLDVDPATITETDEYGNTTDVWTFNSWYKTTKGTADGEAYTGTVIPASNLVIHGTWDHETVTVPDYGVTYVFDTEAPDGKTPPTESRRYVKGQEFDVLDGFEKEYIYDTYGNVVGTWTWGDWYKVTNSDDSSEITDGKMPAADIVIHGKWTYVDGDAPTHTVTVPVDPQDPGAGEIEKEVTNGAYIIVDPNSGVWGHDGNVYEESTNVTIIDDITLEDPTKEDYTFTGWTITETDDGVIKYTANWEINDRDVEYTTDPEGDDPTSEVVVPKGTVITIDPNGGEWDHGGTTHTTKTEITIDDDTKIEDPTRDGYEFKGWEKTTDEDGNITLTAKWERKCIFSKDPCDYVIPAAVITAVGGGITAGAIAGGITTAIVAGSVIGVPAVIVGGTIVYNAIKESKTQDNNAEQEPSDIPYTGSDLTVTLMATAMSVVSMIAAAYIIIENKKRKQSAE